MSDQAVADEVINKAEAASAAGDWPEALRLWEFISDHIDPKIDANGDQSRTARHQAWVERGDEAFKMDV